ncbi:MAG: AMP-binding protein [Planctomycetota bacterium]|jgi:fatty-acyl-CoA synthase
MHQTSYIHRGGSTPLIGSTVGDFFIDVAGRFPEHEAVVSLHQERRLTYGSLLSEADELARGLLGLGVRAGDRVAIWSPDNIEWILLQLATARIGAVLVNINPAYRKAELKHALRKARIQTLFLVPRFRRSPYERIMCELCPELHVADAEDVRFELFPDLERVVLYDPDDPLRTNPCARGIMTWADVIEAGVPIGPDAVSRMAARIDPDDPINIQFTSGTTGYPKAVVLTHHNILNNAWFIAEAMSLTEDDRLCVPVPFYHCFGMVVATLACLTHGAAIVIPAPHFDAGATLAAIQAERCTALHGVPTMFVAELDHPDFDTFDLSSLRTGVMAGAPCPPELVRRVIGDMGCREILIGYGQTESSPVTHLTLPDADERIRTETVGTNLPHQEVKIVDPDTREIVPLGTPGEVCFRGYHIMRGYFDDPEATASTIDEAGWLHSGDLGVLDEDGMLAITGRLKDMIIRGGENIYPAEIEAMYCEHPQVAEIAVFGVPDERLGERVGAWVRLHEGAETAVESLRAWGAEHMAHYKVPSEIWLVDEFPMTVTGKIQKFRIRDMVSKHGARETVPAT